MTEQEKLEKKKKRTKRCCITITILFITCMLIIPLVSVIVNSLKEGIGFYIRSISTEYVRSALGVTFLATVIAVVINTFFWYLCSMAFDEVFIPWKADLSNPDRYSVLNLSGYCRSCLPDDVWQTWMVLSGDPGI